jgi:ABC-type uncharacterized transport system permease subunit
MVAYARIFLIIFFTLLAVILSSLLFLFFGTSPIDGLVTLFQMGFGSQQGLIATVGGAVPLLIMAVGLSVPFTARVWNIGGQGQFVIGSILATWVGLRLAGSLSPGLVTALALLSAFVGGVAWILPPILMKIRLGINEVITTLMMNFIAVFLLDYLIAGPMEGAHAIAYHEPSSDPIPPSLALPAIIPRTNIGVGLLIALLLALGLFFLLRFTRLGFELRVIGQSHDVAKYAGIPIGRDMLLSTVISGGIAGIAGMVDIYGATGILVPQVFSDITTSYGYVGIPVALIASLNPLAIIVSAVFFSGILTGTYGLELAHGVPIEVVIAVYGLVMFLAPLGVYLGLGRRRLTHDKVKS